MSQFKRRGRPPWSKHKPKEWCSLPMASLPDYREMSAQLDALPEASSREQSSEDAINVIRRHVECDLTGAWMILTAMQDEHIVRRKTETGGYKWTIPTRSGDRTLPRT